MDIKHTICSGWLDDRKSSSKDIDFLSSPSEISFSTSSLIIWPSLEPVPTYTASKLVWLLVWKVKIQPLYAIFKNLKLSQKILGMVQSLYDTMEKKTNLKIIERKITRNYKSSMICLQACIRILLVHFSKHCRSM